MPSKARNDKFHGRSTLSDGFGSGARESGTGPARPVRKGPPDKDRCPDGWDADLWHLVLLFEQYARADDIQLSTGRPVIYMELDAIVKQYGVRTGRYRQEVQGCEKRWLPDDRADRCWYHWPPSEPARQVAGTLTWVQMVEIVMAEFWSRIQDHRALDYFRQYFLTYGEPAFGHWKSLAIVSAIEARPRAERPVMRRGTMAATSKEG